MGAGCFRVFRADAGSVWFDFIPLGATRALTGLRDCGGTVHFHAEIRVQTRLSITWASRYSWHVA
jgi:hypothetical protein